MRHLVLGITIIAMLSGPLAATEPKLYDAEALAEHLTLNREEITEDTYIKLPPSIKEVWVEHLDTDTAFIETELRSYADRQARFLAHRQHLHHQLRPLEQKEVKALLLIGLLLLGTPALAQVTDAKRPQHTTKNATILSPEDLPITTLETQTIQPYEKPELSGVAGEIDHYTHSYFWTMSGMIVMWLIGLRTI